MMESAVFMDDEAWPTLSGGPIGTTTTAARPAANASAATEDWEMLHPKEANLSFEVVDNNDAVSSSSAAASTNESRSKPVNRKMLRHCESSPNLSAMDKIVEQTPPALNLPDSVHEEDDSFAMVSGPPSVMTATTTATVSWADLAGSPTKQNNTSTGTPRSIIGSLPRSEPRARIQPKFVVVHTKQMRRCTKSTGDLQALAGHGDEEEEEGGGGACDAMEFYHRKAVGAASRFNGLKLRPDEQARKQIILNKKSEQRMKQQAQQARTGRKSKP